MNDGMGVSDDVVVSIGRGAVQRDGVFPKGNVLVELFGPDGGLKEHREVHNLVVTTGLAHIADALSSAPGQTAMSHMAVGTGVVAAAAGDTTLGTEIDRNALTSFTDAAAVVTYVGDWAAGDATNAAITEAGILNAASAGTLLARAVFTAINKGASDTLKITWTISLSAS